jgi:phosphohistidine phosphatase SixA
MNDVKAMMDAIEKEGESADIVIVISHLPICNDLQRSIAKEVLGIEHKVENLEKAHVCRIDIQSKEISFPLDKGTA